jgi:hypothetical protein
VSRRSHPHKDVEDALRYAESHGWTVDVGGGHCWGGMKCPENAGCRGGHFCLSSIWSTPKNPGNFAKQVRRAVDNCTESSNQSDTEERNDGI